MNFLNLIYDSFQCIEALLTDKKWRFFEIDIFLFSIIKKSLSNGYITFIFSNITKFKVVSGFYARPIWPGLALTDRVP
ncbi:hypothetical protein MNBD_BACTEROID01-354 [hydrothermal vent metagenome]|uniref:Uncharacterized protein n=1 Tax=hydrothermal vent metagenome TaxID=652676 RepID=A0A3B0UEY1_9ZZZZ